MSNLKKQVNIRDVFDKYKIGNMPKRKRFWTTMDAVVVDPIGYLWIDTERLFCDKSDNLKNFVSIERLEAGFRIDVTSANFNPFSNRSKIPHPLSQEIRQIEWHDIAQENNTFVPIVEIKHVPTHAWGRYARNKR